jgi:hypothetical protein
VDTKKLSDLLLPLISALVLWTLVTRGGDPLWLQHLQTDCGTYHARAKDFLTDFSWGRLAGNEYQPGALWFFSAVGGLCRGGSFIDTLVWINVAMLFAHIWLARRVGGRGHGWAMLGLVAGMGPILLYRFEAFVSLLVILSICAARGSVFSGTASAGALLGGAVATKLYPLILLLGLVGHALRKWGAGAAGASLLGVAVGLALPTLALLAWGGETSALANSIHYHFNKPVGVDGFWGTAFPLAQWAVGEPLKMASRNAIHGFDPSIPGVPGWVLQFLTWGWVPICGILSIAAIGLRGGKLSYGPGAAFAIIGTYVAFAKLSTPQYLWWAVPLLAFTPRRWFTEGEKILLFGLLAGCLTLGQLVFPLHYSEFLSSFHQGRHLESWLFWTNAAKNFLWAAVVAVGIRALIRHLGRGWKSRLIFQRGGNMILPTMKTTTLFGGGTALTLALSLILTGCNPPPAAPQPNPDAGKAPEAAAGAGGAGVGSTNQAAVGKEKFAAVKVSRNTSNSKDAEAFIKNYDGSVDVKLGPEQANNYDTENGTCAAWIYHAPLDPVIRADGNPFPDIKQLSVDGDGVYIWTKTQHRGLPGFKVAAYYRTDGKEPFGSRGVGEDGSQASFLEYSHNSPSEADGSDAWWRVGPLPAPQGEESFTYKIGVWRE